MTKTITSDIELDNMNVVAYLASGCGNCMTMLDSMPGVQEKMIGVKTIRKNGALYFDLSSNGIFNPLKIISLLHTLERFHVPDPENPEFAEKITLDNKVLVRIPKDSDTRKSYNKQVRAVNISKQRPKYRNFVLIQKDANVEGIRLIDGYDEFLDETVELNSGKSVEDRVFLDFPMCVNIIEAPQYDRNEIERFHTDYPSLNLPSRTKIDSESWNEAHDLLRKYSVHHKSKDDKILYVNGDALLKPGVPELSSLFKHLNANANKNQTTGKRTKAAILNFYFNGDHARISGVQPEEKDQIIEYHQAGYKHLTDMFKWTSFCLNDPGRVYLKNQIYKTRQLIL